MSTIVIEGGITIETGIAIGIDVAIFLVTQDINQLITETGDSFVEEQSI
jgi:hypothetical protein